MMLLPGAARTSIQQSFESRRTEFRNTVAQTVHDPCGRGPLDMTQENSHLNHLQHVGLDVGLVVVGATDGLAVGLLVVGIAVGLAVGLPVVGVAVGLAVGLLVVGVAVGLAGAGFLRAALQPEYDFLEEL